MADEADAVRVTAEARRVALQPGDEARDVLRRRRPLRRGRKAIGGVDAEHPLARKVHRYVAVDLGVDIAVAAHVGAAVQEDDDWSVLQAVGAKDVRAVSRIRSVREVALHGDALL